MPCHHVTLPGGAHAIVRTASPRARACSVCQIKVRDYKLCDWPIGGVIRRGLQEIPRTCDAVLCRIHATHIEPDTDYCPLHAAAGKLKL